MKVICERPDKTIYRDGDFTIKVFNENYSKAKDLNEALNQARVEETGLRVPKLHEVKKINGKWAIVTDYIEGKTLEDLMNENPDKMGEYIERLVDIQTDVLSHTVTHLNKLRDKMHAKISSSDINATIRYELHTRLDATPKHNKVCHGDFHPSNIIVTENDEAYIIDWAHVTRGNGAADAARVYLLFTLEGKKEAAEKYLQLFCAKTDTAKQYVQKWMPIVAASQLAKGVEPEKELLHSWIDVVDYE